MRRKAIAHHKLLSPSYKSEMNKPGQSYSAQPTGLPMQSGTAWAVMSKAADSFSSISIDVCHLYMAKTRMFTCSFCQCKRQLSKTDKNGKHSQKCSTFIKKEETGFFCLAFYV